MAFTIVPGQTATFEATVAPNTTLKGTPVWRSSDPDVTLTPSTDGMDCTALIPVTFKSPTFNLVLATESADPSVGHQETTHSVEVVSPNAVKLADFTQTGGAAQASTPPAQQGTESATEAEAPSTHAKAATAGSADDEEETTKKSTKHEASTHKHR